MSKKTGVRLPSKIEALVPIVVLLALMIGNYILGWGQDPHIPVLIACAVAMGVGCLCGVSYKDDNKLKKRGNKNVFHQYQKQLQYQVSSCHCQRSCR